MEGSILYFQSRSLYAGANSINVFKCTRTHTRTPTHPFATHVKQRLQASFWGESLVGRHMYRPAAGRLAQR
jgi:hypothetical protein